MEHEHRQQTTDMTTNVNREHRDKQKNKTPPPPPTRTAQTKKTMTTAITGEGKHSSGNRHPGREAGQDQNRFRGPNRCAEAVQRYARARVEA